MARSANDGKHAPRLAERSAAEDKLRTSPLREAAEVGLADFASGNFTSFDDEGTLASHLAALASEAGAVK